MEPLEVRDGEGAERHETAEQIMATELETFRDRAAVLIAQLEQLARELQPNQSQERG